MTRLSVVLTAAMPTIAAAAVGLRARMRASCGRRRRYDTVAGGACVCILRYVAPRGSDAADTRTPPIASRERPVSFWLAAWVWFRTCACASLCLCVRLCACVCARKISLAATGHRCVRVRLSARVFVCACRRRRGDDATTATTRIRDSLILLLAAAEFLCFFFSYRFSRSCPLCGGSYFFFISVRSSHSAYRFQYLLYNNIQVYYIEVAGLDIRCRYTT